jgi:hypothetical protein
VFFVAQQLHTEFDENLYFLYNIKAMDRHTLQHDPGIEPEYILFFAKKRERIAPKSRADGFRQHLENKTGRRKVYVPVGQRTPWK